MTAQEAYKAGKEGLARVKLETFKIFVPDEPL
jgi:hypothetical protein